jgi:hypothetical protein
MFQNKYKLVLFEYFDTKIDQFLHFCRDLNNLNKNRLQHDQETLTVIPSIFGNSAVHQIFHLYTAMLV